ncbi:MAG: coenzyme F420-0:L-glutamate ligase [Solirubrobacterales bacterium]|nr:coenzyme F420-0:L-glutamate ligase [Solirubrobacterales bacterium]
MKLSIEAVAGLPEIAPADDLAGLISSGAELEDGDIVVIAQKAVSKAEGRFADPSSIDPGTEAVELAGKTGKDPGLVQLILDESTEVLRATKGVLIVETLHGFICANAGIDSSNVPGDGRVLLLPVDSDRSARSLRAELQAATGKRLAVLVTDSFGRAWRSGQLDVAIGCAGIEPLIDERGDIDRDGREMNATIQAVADELAAASDLARSKTSGEPVVVIRGRSELVITGDGPGAAASLRDRTQDLFR